MRVNKRIKRLELKQLNEIIDKLRRQGPQTIDSTKDDLLDCIMSLRDLVQEQSKEIDKLYDILNEHESGLG